MLLFLKYLISRDSYFHRKLSCVKINITLEFSSSGNHSSHRREENFMKENKKSVSTRKVSSHCKTSKEKQEDFIMLPTVDFCFKELMQNDNIRKNIIAALLNVPPSEVENTELMPTILRKESKDDKYGILDVRVKLHIIIFWMIKNVIAELYSVMQRQEKSIQILWRCIS